ncbi:MAG: Dna2/Cas4 domain-containing protein [Chloroflexi bacterium]|nr:Dna2/Cas4 domain-containing protein [Chloroflexota bacterium]MBU1748846.1 Dna2/Cas4 domain-containing protein [Chloroflexota bacterium]
MVLLAGAVLVAALLLLRGAGARRSQAGLPRGRVVYQDTTGEPARPLFSNRYRLTGRPDYVIQERGAVVPMEVKPGRTAQQPYDGDVLQLGAYCLLVEESEHRRPPHGYLRYADHTFQIPYTDELRTAVLDALDDIRHDLRARDVAPSHDDPARCRGCGLRDECGEALA